MGLLIVVVILLAITVFVLVFQIRELQENVATLERYDKGKDEQVYTLHKRIRDYEESSKYRPAMSLKVGDWFCFEPNGTRYKVIERDNQAWMIRFRPIGKMDQNVPDESRTLIKGERYVFCVLGNSRIHY